MDVGAETPRSALRKLVPAEVVGSSEAAVSKLIIRTAVHVKVGWWCWCRWGWRWLETEK